MTTFGDERDYPYNPKANVYTLEGLDKLRAIEDREQAALLYDLYQRTLHVTPEQRREAELSDQRQRHQRLLREARQCLAGRKGESAKQLAELVLIDDTKHDRPMRSDPRSLEAFWVELQTLERKTA